ncbi:PrgI family protein [Flavobacterium piscisymbiosum]|uniref:PrgI family protein n=1 Tax=Flavobacterium piscisymbiosum TaxID=2893753 RepID=A0ABS8MJ32_9FLAO|nr:PrgI family protein [Flavobacterium sp. F-30]MCC9065505.1 PrgI family protein [Flavobacterium sp. F-30]
MENLNFIDPLLHGITPEKSTNKIPNLSAKQLACAGVSTLIVGAVLKKAGQNTIGNLIGGFALPLLASAAYKQFNKISKAKKELTDSSGIEYNH